MDCPNEKTLKKRVENRKKKNKEPHRADRWELHLLMMN